MKISRSRVKNGERMCLPVRKFPFPVFKIKRAVNSQDQVKSEAPKLRKPLISRSASLAKIAGSEVLVNFKTQGQISSKPCKSLTPNGNTGSEKCIHPVKSNFFNTQFGKKKMIFRAFTPSRRATKPQANYLKPSKQDIRSVRYSSCESLTELYPAKYSKENDSNMSEECKSTNRRRKVKVQAWIPQALMIDH